MAVEQLTDAVGEPTDEAKRLRARSVRNIGLFLVLVGFAALLYAMTLARLLG